MTPRGSWISSVHPSAFTHTVTRSKSSCTWISQPLPRSPGPEEQLGCLLAGPGPGSALLGLSSGGHSLCGERHLRALLLTGNEQRRLPHVLLHLPQDKRIPLSLQLLRFRAAPALAECPDGTHPSSATWVSHRPPPQLALLLG